MFDPMARCAACGQRGTRCHCQDCVWCGELVLRHDATYHFANGPVAHHACAFRQVMGSVAHLQQRCSCYVPGATEGDPAGLTRRQAAAAVLALWQAQHAAPDEDEHEHEA